MFVANFVLIPFVCLCVIGLAHGKTAPEFKLTVDTENFKEIRVPMHLWKKIIARNYNSGDKSSTANKYIKTKQSDVNGTVLHEVVLNVVVPEDGAAVEEQAIQEEILVEPEVPLDSSTLPPSSDAVVEGVEAVVGEEAITDAEDNPSSVLVQTTRFPCLCNDGVCECCATFFQQKGCANLRFLPEDFAFDMRLTMNGNVVAKRKMPVRDPPPFCFNPRRAPFLELCAQLTDISVKKQNVHACVDIDASVGGFDLFSWNYDCIKFGRQGFFAGQKKPDSGSDGFDFFGLGGGDGGGLLDGLLGGGDDDDDDDDDDDGDY